MTMTIMIRQVSALSSKFSAFIAFFILFLRFGREKTIDRSDICKRNKSNEDRGRKVNDFKIYISSENQEIVSLFLAVLNYVQSLFPLESWKRLEENL